MSNIDTKNMSYKIIEDNIIKSHTYSITKRTLDIVGALLGIIFLSPIFLLVAILIFKEDKNGKIIFGHERIGLNGKPFKCYKFRTMVTNSDEIMKNLTEAQKKEYRETFKMKDDPRVTKIGKFLRKSSLDELPQLFNILIGNMTIVGPRPIVREELKKYGQFEEYYKSIKPGLTGLWQVSGRSDTSYEERVELDMEYIIKRNVFLDIYIIFMTAVKIIKREGAY